MSSIHRLLYVMGTGYGMSLSGLEFARRVIGIPGMEINTRNSLRLHAELDFIMCTTTSTSSLWVACDIPRHHDSCGQEYIRYPRRNTSLLPDASFSILKPPHFCTGADKHYTASLRIDIPARVSEEHPRRLFQNAHRRTKSLPRPDENSECRRSPRPSTSSSRSSSKSHASRISSNSEQAWRTPYNPTQRPPLLKLFPAPLDPIPGSPPHSEADDVPESPSSPSFAIPSEAAQRLKKMRRLTRKLGDGVPVELVFPSRVGAAADADSDSDEETPLLETPASSQRLPFSSRLPVIPEDGRQSSFARGSAKTPSLSGFSIVEGPDEHNGLDGLCMGLPASQDKGRKRTAKAGKEQTTVCLGVSASAGQSGKGASRRWVQGAVPFDQVIGSWGGRVC